MIKIIKFPVNFEKLDIHLNTGGTSKEPSSHSQTFNLTSFE